MSKVQWMSRASALFLALAVATGCSQDASGPAAPASFGDGHAEHAHPTKGPHEGDLIELGNEEYYAELVHDEQAGAVTIYLLDAEAKAAVPIEATELTINLKHAGQIEQFKLAASPDVSDPRGKSSRFMSSDAEFIEDIERQDAEPQLVATIDGKQYRGNISPGQHEHGDHQLEDGHEH